MLALLKTNCALKVYVESCVRDINRPFNTTFFFGRILTGSGFFVLRLSKKALAAAQSFSSALSSVGAESSGFSALIFLQSERQPAKVG